MAAVPYITRGAPWADGPPEGRAPTVCNLRMWPEDTEEILWKAPVKFRKFLRLLLEKGTHFAGSVDSDVSIG